MGSHAPSPAPWPVPLPSAGPLGEAIGAVLHARPAQVLDAPASRAAVLIVLYDRGRAPHVVLTKRTETLLHHPGQVSLPGGRFEPEDGGLQGTALRETEEELGIPPAALRVIGRLDDVHTLATSFIVTPFVAVLGSPLRPVPNGEEIARVLEVALAELLSADSRLPPQPDRDTLRYPLLGEDVWGATARILRGFTAVVRDALGASAPSGAG